MNDVFALFVAKITAAALVTEAGPIASFSLAYAPMTATAVGAASSNP